MQIVSGRAVALPLYYDRDPIIITRDFTGAVLGQHAQTERFSWTPTVGHVAFVENMFAIIYVVTAGAANQYSQILFRYKPLDGAEVTMIQMVQGMGVANTSQMLPINGFGLVKIGDILRAYTINSDPVGTANFVMSFKGVDMYQK